MQRTRFLQFLSSWIGWRANFARSFVAADLENPDVVSFELAQRFRALRARLDELEVSREGTRREDRRYRERLRSRSVSTR